MPRTTVIVYVLGKSGMTVTMQWFLQKLPNGLTRPVPK